MSTLKDVAKLAHCNVSTVSRALNNTSYVHPETRARIMEAVKQLGYHPNVLKKGLQMGKRHTIGVVVPQIQLSIFGDLLPGIEQEAKKHGYAILISTTRDNAFTEKEELNRLRNGFIDGMIVAGTGRNNRLIRSIHADGIAITQIIRENDPLLGGVYVDYESIGYTAANYMYSKGCHHIGLINSSHLIIPYRDRMIGYKTAMKEHDLDPLTIELDTGVHSVQYGYDCALRLIDQEPRLDGILAGNDAQGIGVLRALRENGIACPDEIRVISMTGYEVGKMLETSLTAVELPAFEIGERACRMNIEEIERKDPDIWPKPKQVILDAKIVKRESC
ncbi:transcriptional regulator, LacI family [Lachnospiraceae bacterium NK3A20]|nr:transcriptional regulator, LacI family [Lachnospiraceae bacterium NK3A20]